MHSNNYHNYDYGKGTFELFSVWETAIDETMHSFNSTQKPRRAIETIRLIHQFVTEKKSDLEIDFIAESRVLKICQKQADLITRRYHHKKSEFARENPLLAKIIGFFQDILSHFMNLEAEEMRWLNRDIQKHTL